MDERGEQIQRNESVSAPKPWRETLPQNEVASIPGVFKEVLDQAQNNRLDFKEASRQTNRIAVVISAFDAADILPETIRELSGQIKQRGLTGEIFVVLNNGGGKTRTEFDPDLDEAKKAALATSLGVDTIVSGRTLPLEQADANSKSTPREIKLDEVLPPTSHNLRLVIIDQQIDPDNAGKVRALRDVYHFLKSQNQATGYCPQYLLAADAETRLRPVDPRTKKVLTDTNSGLGHMIDLSGQGKTLVGAKLYFLPYDSAGNPDWKAKTPPMQETTSLLHGTKGYEWLPGGATLGGFPEMVSTLSSISQRLPGTRVEDVATTVVAKALGINTTVDTQVVHANRCPRTNETKAVIDQMVRWLSGSEGLRLVAGTPLAEKVVKSNLVTVVAGPLIEVGRGNIKPGKILELLPGLPGYFMSSTRAKKTPDNFTTGTAVFK